MRPETLNDLSARAKAGLMRSLRNHGYEEAPNGLFLPKERVTIGGVFYHSLNGGPLEGPDRNLVVTEGRNHILNVALNNQAQNATWYVALFANNVVPQATWTGANFNANAGEFTGYAETSRPAYNEAAAVAGAIDNYASKASFTINAAGTVYGGAILASNVKAGTSGVLLAAARFSNVRAVEIDDLLQIGYQISLTSA
jgi:hypothetical protein